MAKIRIIAIPPSSFVPEEIRTEWVGVEIPLPTEAQIAEDPPSGVGIGNQNQGGYLVLTSDAIKSLQDAGKATAVRYWKSAGFGKYLRFRRDVCQEIA